MCAGREKLSGVGKRRKSGGEIAEHAPRHPPLRRVWLSTSKKSPHAILGVAQGASADDLKQAYKKKAMHLHRTVTTTRPRSGAEPGLLKPGVRKRAADPEEACSLLPAFWRRRRLRRAVASRWTEPAQGEELAGLSGASTRATAPRSPPAGRRGSCTASACARSVASTPSRRTACVSTRARSSRCTPTRRTWRSCATCLSTAAHRSTR